MMEPNAPVIMLVDDDLDFLELHTHVLETRGYKVVCCSDPEDALDKLTEDRPSLVVTDLMMNALDSGFSFSRALKTDPRFADIPVIILTAISSQRGFDFSPHTPEELAAMHADAYFDKPVAPDALIAKVKELLDCRLKKNHQSAERTMFYECR